MLKDGVVLLIIGLIAIGAIVVWWTQTPARVSSATAGGATAGQKVPESEVAAKTEPAAPKTARIHNPVPLAVDVPSSVAEAAARPEAAVVSPPVVHPDPLPFPAVDQIAPGLRKDSITGKYGQPALSAVTLTGGHLVETFIYARNRSRSATMIRLEDGKVAAAYSRSEAGIPAGVSVPTRNPNE